MNANRGAMGPGARPRGPMGGGPMGGGPMAGLGMSGQKAKNFRGTMFRLLGYFRPEKWKLILVLVAAIISTVFTVVGPKILGLATTRLFEGVVKKFYMHIPGASIDFGYIGDIMLIMLGLYLLSSIFSYVQQFTMAGVSQRVVYNLRREVEEKLGRLPLRYYDSETHGEIMSRAVNDMDNISNTLQQSLTQFITSLVSVVGMIILMLTINWILTLVTLVTLPHQHRRHPADRQALAALLLQPAERAWPAEWPCRGDVHRPPHRQGVWPRAAVSRSVQRDERRALQGWLARAVRLGHDLPADDVHRQPGLCRGRRGR